MAKFQTRMQLAVAKQELLQESMINRLIAGERVANNTKSDRAKKKHKNYTTALISIHEFNNKSLDKLPRVATDAELKAALWKIQRDCMHLARKMHTPIPDCAGVLGRYRYVLEDAAVAEVRRAYGIV